MKQIIHNTRLMTLNRESMKPVFVSLMLLIGAQLHSQQIPVYSAYFFNKYLINPGFTGIDNEYRAFGFYRTQWLNMPGHPNTGGATAEASFWKDQIGVAGYIVNDKIGVFNTVNAALSYAQKVRVAKDHQISLGVQGGVFTNRIDFSSITTADLNDPGLLEQKPLKAVFDMSVGIGYKWKDLLVGFSVPNLLQPLAKYATPGLATNYEYVRHYTGFAQYKFRLLDGKFNITPQLFMRKGPATGFQFDATAMLDYKDIVFIGGGYRNSFGVIGMCGVNVFNMFTIAYAYDYTTQPAITGQVGSTHEIIAGFHLSSHYSAKKRFESKVEIDKDTLSSLQKRSDSLATKVDSTQLALDSALAQSRAMQKINDSLRNQNNQYQKLTDSLAKRADELLGSKITSENGGKRKSGRDNAKGDDSKNGPGASQREVGIVPHRSKEEYHKMEDSLSAKVSQLLAIKKLRADEDLRGSTYKLDKIYFEPGKNTLLGKSKQQLEALTGFMSRFPGIHILIIGNTDNTGNDDGNDQLSMARAQAVSEYLIDHGVEAGRLEFQGMGSRNPCAENTTEIGRKLNRRVEFTIVKQ